MNGSTLSAFAHERRASGAVEPPWGAAMDPRSSSLPPVDAPSSAAPTVLDADRFTLGQMLRFAREQRGLTLPQIAEITNIQLTHLEAYERDDLTGTVPGMYQRAEIRAIADAVGLDSRVALMAAERPLPRRSQGPEALPNQRESAGMGAGLKPRPYGAAASIAAAPLATVATEAPVASAPAAPPVTHDAPAVVQEPSPIVQAAPRIVHDAPPIADTASPIAQAALPVAHTAPPTAYAAPPTVQAAPAVHAAPLVPAAPPVVRTAVPTVRARPTRSRKGDLAIGLATAAVIALAWLTLRTPTPSSTTDHPTTAARVEQSAPVAPRPSSATEAPAPSTPPAAAPTSAAIRPAASTTTGAVVQQRATQAADQAPAPASPSLRVITEPAGARVTVDGVGWGQTPLTIRYLPPGAKRIRVTRDGYLAREQMIAIAPDQGQTIVRMALQKER